MEILIALAAIGFVVAILAVRGRSRPARPQQAPRPDPIPAPVSPVRDRRRVFDERSATRTTAPRCLEGPAWITDGDTIRIANTQIRLFGIDAPELNHPYGKQAKWALHKLCKGQTIRAEITAEDDHGRTVARCYLPDGTDLSAEMVRLGLAIDWPKFSGGVYGKLEVPGARKRLYLAAARQRGHMRLWEEHEARQKRTAAPDADECASVSAVKGR